MDKEKNTIDEIESNNIILTLGDIIQIISPVDQNLNNNIYIIDYIDHTIIKLLGKEKQIIELNINIDEDSVLEPDKDFEFHADAPDMSSRDKEVELNFNSDTMSLEIEEETAKIEEIKKDANLEKDVHKKSVQKIKPTEVEEEIYLEPEDLKISLDSDED